MIVIRNTFQLKYGKAKEAITLMKKLREVGGSSMDGARVLTDVTGPYYTMVLEFTEKDLATWEASRSQDLGNPAMRPFFEQFSALVDTGHREIYNIVD